MIRVVQRAPPKGFAAAAAVLGLIVGLPVSLFYLSTSLLGTNLERALIVLAFQLLSMFALPTLFATACVLSVFQWSRSFLPIATFCLGIGVAFALVAMLSGTGRSGTSIASMFVEAAGFLGLVGLIGAPLALFGCLCALLAAGMFRTGLIRFVERSESTVYCTKCGYDLIGIAPDSVCPECGRTLKTILRATFGRTAMQWCVLRASRVLVALAAVVLVIATTAIVAHRRTFPLERFGTVVPRASFMQVASPSGPAALHEPAWVAYQPLDQSVPALLFLCTPASARPGLPYAQLQLGFPTAVTSSFAPFTGGEPAITCKLDEAQARYVIEHGLPDSLRQAFLNASMTQGVRPLVVTTSRSNMGPGNLFGGPVDEMVCATHIVEIDATPHFGVTSAAPK